MVSLQTVIIVAALGALFLYRSKIAGALAATGRAIGGGAGAAFGQGLTAFGQQFAAPFQKPAEAAGKWWEGLGGFIEGGGYVGQYFREREQPPPLEMVNLDTMIGSPDDDDPVLTPEVREISDVVIRRPAFVTADRSTAPPSVREAARFIMEKTPEDIMPAAEKFKSIFQRGAPGDHSERVDQAIEAGGLTPSAFFRLMQAQGLDNMEARARMREVYGSPS